MATMEGQGESRSRPRKTATLPLMSVKRATLPDEIYKRIKDMILNGGLVPGELVTIQGLAVAFGVSAMPVREALQRLTAERGLTIVAGRSVGVPELVSERFRDMVRVRVELEGLAAEWATPRIETDRIKALEKLIDVMAAANSAGDTRAFVRANHEFHFAIYRAAGSESLLAIIESLWLQVSPYFHLLYSSGNYTAANQEHRRIVRALYRRRSSDVRRHLERDIAAAAIVLTDLLGGTAHEARQSSAKL